MGLFRRKDALSRVQQARLVALKEASDILTTAANPSPDLHQVIQLASFILAFDEEGSTPPTEPWPQPPVQPVPPPTGVPHLHRSDDV